MQAGSALGQVMVLSERGKQGAASVTRKVSLTKARPAAPAHPPGHGQGVCSRGLRLPQQELRAPADRPALQAARAMPVSAEQAAVGSVVPGYVASVTHDSVFVRFLGELTGRAGEPSQAEDPTGCPLQDVRSCVRAFSGSARLQSNGPGAVSTLPSIPAAALQGSTSWPTAS